MEPIHDLTIKAVFFDVDGTLISFKTNSIPDSTQNAIRKLRAKGIKVIVATGRSINSLEHIKHIDFDGFITFNGGYCMSAEGEIMFKEAIDPSDIRNLIMYSRKHPLSYSLMYEDKVEINDATPELVGMYAHINLPVPPVHDKNHIDTDHVLQANIFLGPDDEKSFMEKVMPNSVSSRWTPLFADVNPGSISKQTGIEYFCRHFGIDLSETMSFGDGGNDISMLKCTKIGIAMGNANDRVKEIADYITEDVDHHGIEKALLYFGIF
ncbi:Cof-type HAD-IIB family hydrolase [Chryseobacterium sp. SSA4.19]|uniref:Cof-type HAD-IIB family hydrolase n=1 Tax=Chryseobacterium sp. SSA4.19 TaxID=2919915 RepID=UPI001F4E53B2|nr:Cof-type HAD-IIB family hydrolase [Chryseobacterium sp. SSA4.19]MCJ8153425.1 Cof-type HAD-IIB family hydrolase [Chryseobacterium sp. SSA4.19]